MKSARHLQRLKSLNQVAKRASTGEKILGSLFPSRTSGFGNWGQNRIAQTEHFTEWVYICIDAIACKVASIFPNMAAVVGHSQPGVTVKAGQRALLNLMGRGLGGDPFFGGTLRKTSSWESRKSSDVLSSYVGIDGFKEPTTWVGMGMQEKDWPGMQAGRVLHDGNPTPVGFSSGGHSFLTVGEWRSKALSVVQPQDELEPLEADHPLRRLMENPNPVDTFFDIEYELQMFEELCGVSYEWTPKNRMGKPCERWCIPSHWVHPRTSGGQYVPFYQAFRENMIWDYEIRPFGYPGYAGSLHFPPDEVIVTRWKSPLSKIDGWSKLTAGARWKDEADGISQARWSQMVNQARPELLIELGEGYEDPDADTIARIEAKFLQRVQGAMNYSKPLIVPPGAKATPLSFNPTEMAYFQCLDAETECLTADGWKKYNELTTETRIACYDQESGAIIYRAPSSIHVGHYKGDMHRWSGTRVDALMTPNHRVYVDRPTSYWDGGEIVKKLTPYKHSFRMSKCRVGATFVNTHVWDIKRADELAPAATYGILGAAPAACDTPVPIAVENHVGWRQRQQMPDHCIDPSVWMRFLGYYLSEGCTYSRKVGNGTNGWEIVIAQKKYEDRFREGITATPFKWRESRQKSGVVQWTTSNKGLYHHLLNHCGKGAFDKRIPKYVKAWPAAYLRILLHAMIEGDGTELIHAKGGSKRRKAPTWHSHYYTRSKVLADDVMEIAVKCGYVASLSHRVDKRKEHLGKILYIVHISTHAELDVTPAMRSVEQYDGTIWCVTVPTGLFVVRRNGKAHITGNSMEQCRDMMMSLWRVPGAVIGQVKDLTYGALMGAIGAFCAFAINPRLTMRGQNRTKHLASQFDEVVPAWSQSGHGGRDSGNSSYTRRLKLFYDDCIPADPVQVNQDIAEDRAQFAITPNEVRALRGRAPYKRGGDDPITQGPGGATPLPLNTGTSLEDLAALIEPMTAPQQEAEATEGLAAQGLDESGKPNLPEEADGPANQLSADDHGATGMEPPEEINGEPSKKAWRGRKSPISLPWYITKRDGSHKLSCVMVELDYEDAAQGDIRAMQDRIDDADLADDGKEDVLHVTVKYGLHTDSAGKVRQLVEKYGPIKIKLGSTSLFESPEYDVVKIDVESDDLRYLHKMLTQLLPSTDKHPEYQPHLTLAYVKSGEGQKYVGCNDVAGNEFEFNGVAFSVPDGAKTFIETSSYAFAEKRRGLGRLGRRKSWDSMEDGGRFPRPPADVPEVMDKEGTCKPGETAASTGCTPASGGGGATATATQTPTARLAALSPQVEALGKEIEANPDARSAVARTATRVGAVLKAAALAKFPAIAMKAADVLVYEMALNAVGSSHGAPSAVLMTKAAAWGAAKAWMTARKAITGKSAGAGDAEELHALLEQIAEAAGLEAPTLEQVQELLAAPDEPEKGKGPRNRLGGKR